MEIAESDYEGVPLLRLTGELDHAAADTLQHALDAVLDRSPSVILDVHDCAFMDSRGLSAIGSALRRQKGTRGWMGILGPSPYLIRLFDLIGLTDNPELRIFTDISQLARRNQR